jgi:hypothetical protein
MSSRRVVVVDGSNIATEGRSQPSLVQLDEAVRAYREENLDVEIIVVVDATFAHRIDEAERDLFEEAAAHNELVYPPAGAIGRGDAFLLRIAEKTSAVVLSNDSFQEFHGEHEWLFDKGRLIGGTPVPGVGWIFVPRTPVRGPKSREAVKEAKRTRARVGSKDALQPMPVPTEPPPRRKKVETAIAVATEEAVGDDAALLTNGDAKEPKKRRRKRRGGSGGAGAGVAAAANGGATDAAPLPTLNEPLTFIEFIAEHKLGSQVEGMVESFASHGAFVTVSGARCYIPLSAMGDPPPRSAREVLKKGDERPFVVQALDAARRGIELALPGFVHVSGTPTEETVEAEIAELPKPAPARPAKRSRAKKAAAAVPQMPAAEPIPVVPEAPRVAALIAAKKAVSKKGAVKTASPKATPKAAATKKAAAKKASPAKKKAAVKKALPRAAPVKKKAAVKKAAADATRSTKKAAAVKKASPKARPLKEKAAVKKAGSDTTRAAKKAAAKRR